MGGFELASAPDVNDFLQLADRMRQLSNETDQFATAHCAEMSAEQHAACLHSSRALNDAYMILIGDDLDARLQAAKAGIETLNQVTAAAQSTIREVNKIDRNVNIIVALGGVAVGIIEKDPGAIQTAAGDLANALGGGASSDHLQQPAAPS